jgi:hypothetical protein
MIIVTNVTGRVEHGSYKMTKKYFLFLKQRFQNESNSTVLEEIEKWLRVASNLTETEIYTIARFFKRIDFTIEE